MAISGGEPALQHYELSKLLRRINGKQIYLKTNDAKPEVIQEIMPFVDQFILEIKAPFGDLDACSNLTGLSAEEAASYFKSLRGTLSILQNKSYGIWIRVIPNFINSSTLSGILLSVGKPLEVVLYQFLSNRSLDLPCYDYNSPMPPRQELENLAALAKKHVQRVVVEARAQSRRCQCCE